VTLHFYTRTRNGKKKRADRSVRTPCELLFATDYFFVVH
jgi:hypothetical protein